MTKIISITSIIATILFTGCSSTNTNLEIPVTNVKQQEYPSPKNGETTFENIKESDTLIKVSYKLKGKHEAAYLTIIPTIDKVNQEVKKEVMNTFKLYHLNKLVI